MQTSTTAKKTFEILTIAAPSPRLDSLFLEQARRVASARRTYPHESVAIIGESYGARNNMKVVEEPPGPIFFYYCSVAVRSVTLLNSFLSVTNRGDEYS